MMTDEDIRPTLSAFAVESAVRHALGEDLGGGDVTTDACVPAEAMATAALRSRESLVVAGLTVFAAAFRQVDTGVKVDLRVADGDVVEAGAELARVAGSARSLLRAERVALNFVQRLSGIATLTHRYVVALTPGAATRITDTRKTTPGLRALERYAVRCGGGYNHRNDLGSAVLIKDNHIIAAGGITAAVRRARAAAPHTSRIECEVDTLGQLDEALGAGADIVLLDNFDDAQVGEAVKRVAGSALIEVSGGISLSRVAALSTLGVDIISVGALTHSAAAVDLGLDFDLNLAKS